MIFKFFHGPEILKAGDKVECLHQYDYFNNSPNKGDVYTIRVIENHKYIRLEGFYGLFLRKYFKLYYK